MVPNLDIKRWKEVTASIKQLYQELTVEEQSAFDVLIDHYRIGSFDNPDIKDLLASIQKNLNRHSANRQLQDYLKNFVALCDKYYTSNEDRFKEFKQALGCGRSARPINGAGVQSTPHIETQRQNSRQANSRTQSETQSNNRSQSRQESTRNESTRSEDPNRRRISFVDGTFYVGDIKYGMPNGEGCMYFVNGDRFSGSWKKGVQNGHGIRRYHNGQVYEGIFKNGYCANHGVIKWPDGTRYEGSWNDRGSELLGHGIYFDTDGSQVPVMWKDNKLEPYEPARVRIKNMLYYIWSWIWERIIFVPYIPVLFAVIVSLIKGKWLDAILIAVIGFIVAAIFSYILSIATGIIETIYYWYCDRSKTFRIILMSLFAIIFVWSKWGDDITSLKKKVAPVAVVEQKIEGKWKGKMNGADVLLEIQYVQDTNIEASMIFSKSKIEKLSGVLNGSILDLKDLDKNGWYDGDYHLVLHNDSVISGIYLNPQNGKQYDLEFKKGIYYE
jgi:Uncharacterized protein conserved in bacteria